MFWEQHICGAQFFKASTVVSFFDANADEFDEKTIDTRIFLHQHNLFVAENCAHFF